MAEPIHIGAAADVPEGEAIVVPAATAGWLSALAQCSTRIRPPRRGWACSAMSPTAPMPVRA